MRFPRPAAFLASALVPFVAQASPDIDTALRHIREFYGDTRPGFAMHDTNEAAPSGEHALADAKRLGADGAWPDVDYRSKARSSWPAALHAGRMAGMAAVFAGAKGAERATLAEALHRAFAHWIKADPQCENWWYNQIGVPKHLATAAILMGDELRPEEKAFLLKTVAPRSKIAMTGQNRLWLAGNTLMFALLAGDDALVQKAADTVAGEIVVTTKEGLQPDFSFHQHGAQQQFGNYGLAFATEVSRWAGVLRDTRRKLSPEKLAIFRDYMLKGQNYVSWRGAMDLGACGRQFMPGTPKGKARSIAAAMSECALIDPEHAPEYRAFVERNRPGAKNDLVGTAFYWRSDYLVHRTPDLCFTLKMSSNRVIGAETTNGENMSGYHIADGMLLAYRDGGEYEEIFPAWDWRSLPGTTTTPDAPLPKFGHTQVKTDFVGGVTDGNVAVAAIDYAKDGVKARKSWFFTTTGVIALGADVSGKGRVATCVAQCLRRGPVSGTSWIEHDGLRYTPLDGTRFADQSGASTGNWRKVYNNPSTPKADVTLNLFRLAIDHGADPANARYAYAVTPAGETPDATGLTNTGDVQGAKLTSSKTGYVFWKPGSIGDFAADAPCVVIRDAGTKTLFVADPTQKLKTLTLTLSGKKHVVTLPTGGMAGSTAKVPAE